MRTIVLLLFLSLSPAIAQNEDLYGTWEAFVDPPEEFSLAHISLTFEPSGAFRMEQAYILSEEENFAEIAILSEGSWWVVQDTVKAQLSNVDVFLDGERAPAEVSQAILDQANANDSGTLGRYTVNGDVLAFTDDEGTTVFRRVDSRPTAPTSVKRLSWGQLKSSRGGQP